MLQIDRYQMSLSTHQRLIETKEALRKLEIFVEKQIDAQTQGLMVHHLSTLRTALHDVVDGSAPVDGRDAFMRQADDWGFIALRASERELIHILRCCNAEGAEEIHEMAGRTVDLKPFVRKQPSAT